MCVCVCVFEGEENEIKKNERNLLPCVIHFSTLMGYMARRRRKLVTQAVLQLHALISLDPFGIHSSLSISRTAAVPSSFRSTSFGAYMRLLVSRWELQQMFLPCQM